MNVSLVLKLCSNVLHAFSPFILTRMQELGWFPSSFHPPGYGAVGDEVALQCTPSGLACGRQGLAPTALLMAGAVTSTVTCGHRSQRL